MQPHILRDLARFGGLRRGSGLFPSWQRNLSPAAYLPRAPGRYSEFARRQYPVGDHRSNSALPSAGQNRGANPKVISGRTSYHQVW